MFPEPQHPHLATAKPEEVEWVEADELWTYVGQKKRPTGCGGLLIVLPRKSVDGRWGSWNRNGPPLGCAASSRRAHHLLHRLLALRTVPFFTHSIIAAFV